VIDPALSFGIAAEAYERGRPAWPSELLDGLPVAAEATVVDLGAGTGKLTRLLVKRFARVIAVKPDAAMRCLIDTGEAIAGSAESLPLPDASVDAIFAAEAFHWFDWERALPEIARVLRPGGVLALLWNRYDPRDFVLSEGVMPPSTTRKHGRFVSGEWRSAFTGAPFGTLRREGAGSGARRDARRSNRLLRVGEPDHIAVACQARGGSAAGRGSA
jgi:SAM-dependent methyltransferase